MSEKPKGWKAPPDEIWQEVCNLAGAIGEAQGFLSCVADCPQLSSNIRTAASEISAKLLKQLEALGKKLEQ